MRRECGLILVDDPIEQGLHRLMAVLTTSIPVPGDHPGLCALPDILGEYPLSVINKNQR
jgi:hypothetical protein